MRHDETPGRDVDPPGRVTDSDGPDTDSGGRNSDGPSRRDFMKVTAGTIGGAALPASHASGQAPVSSNVLFDEDFEGYATGTYPGSWTKNGNGDQKVVDSTAAEGGKSLRIKGSSGGCWEALANAPISMPNSGTVTFSGYVKPTSNGQVGCHDNKRGGIQLRTAADDWSSGKGTRLLRFHPDGTVVGPGGATFGSYRVDEWNSFEVTYERSNSQVTLSYTINGDARGSTTRAVASYEDNLSYIRMSSGEFSVFYDGLRAVAQSSPSGPGVEARDFTGDGQKDVKIWNENVWLMLEGRDLDSKRFASRIGQPGSQSSGGPWRHKPTNRSSDQLRHRSTESVDPFETSEGVGYHVRRQFDLSGTPFEEATTVFLPAGGESALVRVRLTNTGSSSITLDQDPGHIHDGVMMVKGVQLADPGSNQRFHTTGSGTHDLESAGTWNVFDLGGTYPTITLFDSSDAISYGLVDGSTGAKQAVTNGDPPNRVDFMVRALSVGAGDTARYTVAIGAHDGGSSAPSWASDAVSDAARDAGSIPEPSGSGGGGGGGSDPNESPTADVAVSPSNPSTGERVTFDASGTTDPDGSIQTVRWDVDGDGNDEDAGTQVTYTYEETGTYEVSVTVTDDDGATDTASTTVTVEETTTKPEAVFEISPSDPSAGERVTFDASETTDPDGQINAYEWDLDGNGTVDDRGETVTYTYGEAGTYTVALTVVDADGNEALTTKTFSVGESTGPKPAFTVSPDSPMPGDQVTFDASGSTDPDGNVSRYEWDVNGDGTTDLTGETVTHTFDAQGEYTVTLAVADDTGATNTLSKQVSVGGQFASVKQQKLATADAVDNASILSTLDWFDGSIGDRPIAETTIGKWESAMADGSVEEPLAVDAVDRLHAAEVATRDVLGYVSPGGGNQQFNFASRMASSLSSVLLDLLLMKLSIANKILKFAPSWVTGTIKDTIGATIEDGIVGLLGDFLNLSDARTKAKQTATSEMDNVWDTITDGAADVASAMETAIGAVQTTITTALRASVEFFSTSLIEQITSPPDDLADLVMGNSIWAATFDLHEELRPSAVGSTLPGSTQTALSARDEGLNLVDSRLRNVTNNLDAFDSMVADMSIYESIQDVVRADGWLDLGWELVQTVVNVAVELAGIVIDATAAVAAGMSLWLTRKLHNEIVTSVVTGENHISGWPTFEV